MAVLSLRRVPLVLAGVLTAVLGGCTREPVALDVEGSALQVNAVLVAGSDSAVVTVAVADAESYWPVPVPGADVRVIHDGDETQLTELAGPAVEACLVTDSSFEPDPKGCYVGIFTRPISPGDSLRLVAVLPDGRVVRGRVNVPTAPLLGESPASSSIELACPGTNPFCDRPRGGQVADTRIEWTAGIGTGWIEIGYRATRVFHDDQVVPDATCRTVARPAAFAALAGTDSTDVRIESVSCWVGTEYVPWDSVRAELRVTAYDTAYGRYRSALDTDGGSIRRRHAAAGLEGALGFFAAAATEQRTLTFRRAPD